MTTTNEYQALDSIIREIARQSVGNTFRSRFGDDVGDYAEKSNQVVDAFLALPGAKAPFVEVIADQLDQMMDVSGTDGFDDENASLDDDQFAAALAAYRENIGNPKGEDEEEDDGSLTYEKLERVVAEINENIDGVTLTLTHRRTNAWGDPWTHGPGLKAEVPNDGPRDKYGFVEGSANVKPGSPLRKAGDTLRKAGFGSLNLSERNGDRKRWDNNSYSWEKTGHTLKFDSPDDLDDNRGFIRSYHEWRAENLDRD